MQISHESCFFLSPMDRSAEFYRIQTTRVDYRVSIDTHMHTHGERSRVVVTVYGQYNGQARKPHEVVGLDMLPYEHL